MATPNTQTKQKDTEPVGRVVRIRISPSDWRTLRVRAAERDEPMSAHVGAILAREAQKARRSRPSGSSTTS